MQKGVVWSLSAFTTARGKKRMNTLGWPGSEDKKEEPEGESTDSEG